MIRIALYDSEKANIPVVKDLDWENLTNLLHTYRFTPCGDQCPGRECPHKLGPAWSPHTLVPGKPRGRGNVLEVTVAVFDLDHLAESDLDALLQRLMDLGLRTAVHTTHNHRPPNECSVRVACELSRPVLDREWPAFRSAVEREYQIPADAQTKDSTRIYFLPTSPEGRTPQVAWFGDRPIDVDAVLAKHHQPTQLVPQVPEYSGEAQHIDLHALWDLALRTKNEDARQLVRLAQKGEPIAEEGGRDDALTRLVGSLVYNLPLSVPREAIIGMVEPSVRVMPGDQPAGDTWLSLARKKIDRARDRRAAELVAQAEENERIRAALAKTSAQLDGHSAADIDADGHYTNDALQRWAKEQGCASVNDLISQFVVKKSREDCYYVFRHGAYSRPRAKADLKIDFTEAFAPAPFPMVTTDRKGNVRELTVDELLEGHVKLADERVYSLILQKSVFDAKTRTFIEACCPLRTVATVEHPEIQEWLKIIAGDRAESLLRWLATAHRLEKPTCALYIDAPKDMGKNLLANCIASLWTDKGPAMLKEALDNFNACIKDCPLLFADEALPKLPDITSLLRSLVTLKNHRVNDKHEKKVSLVGYPRVLVVGNNRNLLTSRDHLTSKDVDAIDIRFLYLNAPQAAADYLKTIGGATAVNKWLEHGLFAEHIAWLRTQIDYETPNRLWVDGDLGQLKNQFTIDHVEKGNAVCDWLANFLSHDPARPLHSPTNLLVGCGELWVKPEAMTDPMSWELFASESHKKPSNREASAVLRELSDSGATIRPYVGTARPNYWRLRSEVLFQWMEQNSVGNPDVVKARLEAPNDLMVKTGLLKAQVT